MKKLIFIGFSILSFAACSQSEPRKPITASSGSFLQSSVERNKKLLNIEEKQIQDIIAKDSLHQYIASPNGYWYYFNFKNTDSTANYNPKEDDLVKLNYNITYLNGDTIYSSNKIGAVTYKVDKQNLFPGLRTGVKLLQKGDTVTFLFPSVMGYGYHGDENKIAPNTPIKSKVTLIDILEKSKDSINTDK
ncbi:gliding motility-associated peptidyl-prolyl isomerase GldI [Zhouia sp. PK063]|uniref:gliding motility-associated peptidyl-prolyl isomerase GldI n=1 Tax=Zhouia sp. PK063 TaxID=3373602 RepID=UPI0037896324